MKEQQQFTPDNIKTINEAVAMAEELVSDFYKMTASEWLRPKYDVQTHKDLKPEEIVSGPFAQIIRYEGRLTGKSLGSNTYDYYKICLQDHSILTAIQNNPQLRLLPFTLYIATHELIHIVRFSKFLQNFNAKIDERMPEEARVHELTHEILSPIRINGLYLVLQFYNQWRAPIDDVRQI